MRALLWSIIAMSAGIASCQRQLSDAAPTTAPSAPQVGASSAAQVAAAASESSRVRSSLPVAKDGVYELADVLLWAMPDAGDGHETLAGLQDYNRFKGVVSKIQSSASRRGGYEGQVVIGVGALPAIAENIQDDYAWKTYIFGPNAGAAGFEISSSHAIRTEAAALGPVYLRAHGLKVLTLACFSEGATATNADALYLVHAPGKAPTLMGHSVSTGSAGQFVTFTLHFGPVDWKDLPGTKPDHQGEVQPFAICPYKEFR